MRTLICIPTYNEIENIQSIVESIISLTSKDLEILVIDDNSPDGTGKLADTLAEKSSRVHVLHRQGKLGLGKAYVNSFQWALARDYQAVVTMDADFSHSPKYVPTLLELLEKNDMVVGSRYVPGGGTVNWGIGRKILSRCGSIYARTILNADVRDFTSGFSGMRRTVLEKIDINSLKSDGYSFTIELKYRAHVAGFKITEFPIVFEDRKVGKSKMNGAIIAEALARVWGYRWRTRQLRRELKAFSRTA